jgi:CheY-like chemotaxis protein
VKTVLIADDSRAMRLLVHATIASDQYAVIQAADGDEAWRLLQEHYPAVAVLDIQMPGRNGLDLLRLIRATPEMASMHVVLLSAQAQPSDVDAGLAAGADHYLTKPFSPLELLNILDVALEESL